MPEELP